MWSIESLLIQLQPKVHLIYDNVEDEMVAMMMMMIAMMMMVSEFQDLFVNVSLQVEPTFHPLVQRLLVFVENVKHLWT